MQKKSPRHVSRILAMQGIYHNKLNPTSIIEIEKYLAEEDSKLYNKAQYELMHFILEQSILNFDDQLERYRPYLNREIAEINLLEQVILVMAAIELSLNISTPAAVIINEAVELAKYYGASDSHKFINGLVDKLAREIRHEEIKNYIKK